MTINSVKKEDRGTYYCVADNNIGKPAQRAVSVEIEFAPTVTQTPSPGKYSLIVYLTDRGTYPQLPTQPKKNCSGSN